MLIIYYWFTIDFWDVADVHPLGLIHRLQVDHDPVHDPVIC